MTNSGGWKGSYYDRNEGCSGPTWSLVNDVIQRTGSVPNVSMTFYGGPLANYPGAYPEQVIDQVNRDQQTSAFTACAYATGMGFVDICVGAFTATPARDLLSLNLDLWAEPVYLIAPKAQSNGFLQNITKAFSPLTARVWLCVLAFLFVASLLVMVQDFGFQAVEGLFWERIPYLLEAIGYRWYSFWNDSGKLTNRSGVSRKNPKVFTKSSYAQRLADRSVYSYMNWFTSLLLSESPRNFLEYP